jgi:hypothetical protein
MGPDDERINQLLRALDHPVPQVTADAIARRAARRPPRVRWAAAVLLALGAAGAAFALPGSPLRRWVVAVAERWSGAPAPTAPRPSQEGDRGDAGAGIAVDPGAGLLVLFEAPAAGGVRVNLADRSDVLVRAPRGHASFTSGGARLTIASRGVPDTFTVEIPRTAPRVEIRAGSSRLLLKQGERVMATVEPDSGGAYLLPLPESP